MKEISLTKGQIALVDDEDFEFINSFNWYAYWNSKTQTFYALSHEKAPGRKTIYMHRMIAGTPKNMITDHINHNTLDNRRDNLRICNASQNMMNQRLSKSNKTGFKGISLRGNRFEAKVVVNRKIVFRNWFSTLEEAIAAYEEAAKKYHGEFKYKS